MLLKCPHEGCELSVLEDFVSQVAPPPVVAAEAEGGAAGEGEGEGGANAGGVRGTFARALVKSYVEVQSRRSHKVELSFCKNPRGCEGVPPGASPR